MPPMVRPQLLLAVLDPVASTCSVTIPGRKWGVSWWCAERSIASSLRRAGSISGSASWTSGLASSDGSAPERATGRRLVLGRLRATTAARRGRAGAGGLADGHGGLAGDLVLVGRSCRAGCRPCRSRPSRRCGRRWSWPRGSRSRCRRSVCSGADPRGTTRCGSSRRRRGGRALDPDAEGAGLLGVLHGRFIARRKHDLFGELVGDALGDQRGVELGLLDLLDVPAGPWVAGQIW